MAMLGPQNYATTNIKTCINKNMPRKKCLNFVENIDSPDMQLENRFQGLHAESSRITWTDQKLDTLTENILRWLDLRNFSVLAWRQRSVLGTVCCFTFAMVIFCSWRKPILFTWAHTCIVFPLLLFFKLWPPPMSNELILHGCGPGLPYCSNSWNKLTNENIK